MAHRNVDLVTGALAAGGANPARVARVTVLPEAVTTAAAAAAALGVEVGQIANSLVFDADGAPLLVLTSGAHRVDTGRAPALLGVSTVRRASPEFVRAATGQAIGGVAPVGHPAPLRAPVDRALRQYGEVWAAGGIPHGNGLICDPWTWSQNSACRGPALGTDRAPVARASAAARAGRPAADRRPGPPWKGTCPCSAPGAGGATYRRSWAAARGARHGGACEPGGTPAGGAACTDSCSTNCPTPDVLDRRPGPGPAPPACGPGPTDREVRR